MIRRRYEIVIDAEFADPSSAETMERYLSEILSELDLHKMGAQFRLEVLEPISPAPPPRATGRHSVSSVSTPATAGALGDELRETAN